MLTTRWAKEFLPQDVDRGYDYFRDGHVFDVTRTDRCISASVAGSYNEYEVLVGYGIEKQFDQNVDCTCPRFQEANCKHLWAVLTFIDAHRIALQPKVGKRQKKTAATPVWKSFLQNTSSLLNSRDHSVNVSLNEKERQIFYVVDLYNPYTYQRSDRSFKLKLLQQEKRSSGGWGTLKDFAVNAESIDALCTGVDREILRRLLGHAPALNYYSYQGVEKYSRFTLSPSWSSDLFALLASSERFFLSTQEKPSANDLEQIRFDSAGPFRIGTKMQFVDATGESVLHMFLERDDERIAVEDIRDVAANAMALVDDRLVTLENSDVVDMFRVFQQSEEKIVIAADEQDDFVEQFVQMGGTQSVTLPAEWEIKTHRVKPQGRAILTASETSKNKVDLAINFLYNETVIDPMASPYRLYNVATKTIFERDLEAEDELQLPLQNFPLQQNYYSGALLFHQKHLAGFVKALAHDGWEVLWEGKPIKQPGKTSVSIQTSSSIDWFDVHAAVEYGTEQVAIPKLLEAAKSGSDFVVLSDGSRGHLPKEFMQRYLGLVKLGELQDDDTLRFKPTQAMILDAMLDAQEQDTQMDAAFKKLRKELASFDGVKPLSAPKTLQGQLRDYQRMGYGWLRFLQKFQLGGCLADDMGLGKTIQVLSLLEQRRTRKKSAEQSTPKTGSSAVATRVSSLSRRPSLIVVPKSLIFNWIDEAARFAPKLQLLDYTGTQRKSEVKKAQDFDCILTTYGTMRKDVADLSEIEFDYVILDESQAIKNGASLTAKASRLIKAEHRLAMTGTPIENHLGDLWSLFEFLNPGMLGTSASFKKLAKENAGQADSEALEALRKGLQPFILRRTKEEVLPELPPKSEQHLYCEMTPAQRKNYGELQKYYQAALSNRIESDGIKKSKIYALEALLRLRQIACDPRLIDPSVKPGAKLELVQQQIQEVVEKGHKVLVFSQFTSLLDLCKTELEKQGIVYEYLTGRTRKREEKVKRFQEDPAVSVFLISLKAGGSGLNLTAADYIYLLDPWWNPAAEAQAIDRAHRIGQTKSVMAYRVIAKGTVEEKIIDMQKEKKNLAESVLSSDESLLQSMSAEDLQMLLS